MQAAFVLHGRILALMNLPMSYCLTRSAESYVWFVARSNRGPGTEPVSCKYCGASIYSLHYPPHTVRIAGFCCQSAFFASRRWKTFSALSGPSSGSARISTLTWYTAMQEMISATHRASRIRESPEIVSDPSRASRFGIVGTIDEKRPTVFELGRARFLSVARKMDLSNF